MSLHYSHFYQLNASLLNENINKKKKLKRLKTINYLNIGQIYQDTKICYKYSYI